MAGSILGFPVLTFLVLGLLALLARTPPERVVARSAGLTFGLSLLATLATFTTMELGRQTKLVLGFGPWFQVGGYDFEITLLLDRLSLPFLLLTSTAAWLIGVFSVRYLHRDPGFVRFFALLMLFACGMLLIVLAGNLDVLIVGWELVGLASSLLISFFHHRKEPVRNGLRAFVTYRICDMGLMGAAGLIHHYAHAASFGPAFEVGGDAGALAALPAHVAPWVGLLLVFAAMGKSAQVPFSGWLPRAMEGPTPSSAIFYGTLSIHAGSFLLLRAQPVLERAPAACILLVVIGLLTSVHGTMSGRVQADAKTSLAYASMCQVGLILVEIGLGLPRVAMVHLLGHACLRTVQFLRAPSLMQDLRRVEAAAGGPMGPTGQHIERLLPLRVQRFLYHLSVERGHLDTFLEMLLVQPFLRVGQALDGLEQRWLMLLSRKAGWLGRLGRAVVPAVLRERFKSLMAPRSAP
ncbi:MAG TPA: proton-conducting transporter membrane subunit [Polyangia bacterium]|jgi:NADH:ubiquinone oxidoreductase subunit 5 (subunit L)/multisubunit Na+/H+ antiporter MnhA subunit|nr:proton-conducting transporter membrane subunit [Polyangia bacterium]